VTTSEKKEDTKDVASCGCDNHVHQKEDALMIYYKALDKEVIASRMLDSHSLYMLSQVSKTCHGITRFRADAIGGGPYLLPSLHLWPKIRSLTISFTPIQPPPTAMVGSTALTQYLRSSLCHGPKSTTIIKEQECLDLSKITELKLIVTGDKGQRDQPVSSTQDDAIFFLSPATRSITSEPL